MSNHNINDIEIEHENRYYAGYINELIAAHVIKYMLHHGNINKAYIVLDSKKIDIDARVIIADLTNDDIEICLYTEN